MRVAALVLPALLATQFCAHGAEVVVQVLQNRFEPEVAEVSEGDELVFQVGAGSGIHRVTALDPVALPGFDSGPLAPGEAYRYPIGRVAGDLFYASDRVEGMTGALSVVSPPTGFAIDGQVSAGWFNPEADGQGLLFEYVPSTNVLVAYWFTFDFVGGRQLWLIGTATPQGGRATLDMLEATGGRLNHPQPVAKPSWGQITVDFSSCENATVYYNASADQRSGRVPLDRLYLSSLCQ